MPLLFAAMAEKDIHNFGEAYAMMVL
jgi:hypothetical protein